jgi:eukaryotic-like serine/threonine-protein kinase
MEAGARLGAYDVIGPLGAGGMGEVYRARDSRLNRDVAIKVLPASLAASPEARARFEREALAVAALSHPNILSIFHFGDERGVSFAVTELLEGTTLREALASGPIPPARALDYAQQILAGLAAAHDKGMVHRDLKPENVFVTTDGRIKILDFGLAKQVSSAGEVSATDAYRTEPGTVLGTIGYMSPEQVRGLPVDHRSDLFSFGAILYELLSGTKAFIRGSAGETMAAILKEDPPPERVPVHFHPIVRHLLEKDPDKRFQSAADIASAIHALATTNGRQMSNPARTTGWRTAAMAAGAAVLLVLIGFWAWTRVGGRSGTPSVAVLPFVNMSPDKDNEYFSDGFTEDLITALSKASGLHVAARTSSFSFKGKNEDVRAIGEKLNVGAVLEGSVSKVGNRLRVTAQLIDATNGYHLWSDTYDRDLQDVFAVRSQLAQTVASALRVNLVGEEKATIERKPTDDMGAYQLYLKGRHEISSFTAEGYENGIRHLQEAVARDPSYALAHLGIAYYYVAVIDIIPGSDAMPRARAAAEKALALDPSLAEAHADIAFASWLGDRDRAQAEREFEKALQMAPSLAYAHEVYSWYLVAVGEIEKGLAESRRAVALDPLNSETNVVYGFNLYFAHRYDEAIRQLRTTLAVDPDYFWAHEFLGRAYTQTGALNDAVSELEIARRLAALSEVEAALGSAYAARGDRAGTQKILAALEQRASMKFVPSYHLAMLHARLGETDKALTLLEKADAESSYWSGWIRLDPDLAALRTDPRLERIARKIVP